MKPKRRRRNLPAQRDSDLSLWAATAAIVGASVTAGIVAAKAPPTESKARRALTGAASGIGVGIVSAAVTFFAIEIAR